MAKKTVSRSIKNLGPLIIAGLCLLIGLLGIWYAATFQSKPTNSGASANPLRVITGSGLPSSSKSQGGQQLQQAAQVKDLAPGKETKDLQPGGGVDNLLKDKRIQ